MLFVLRDGKSGVLYIRLNLHRSDVGQGDLAESLAHEKFRSGHVIGSQRSVRRSIRQSYDITLGIADVPAVAVTTAYSPHITYIMAQQRDYEMQPFAWRDTPLADVFAAQDLLTNQRHQDSMIHVVVRSIAIGNIFQCQSCDEPDDAGITGLKHPVELLILLLELFNKRVDDDLYGVKHCHLHPSKCPAMRRTHSRYGAGGGGGGFGGLGGGGFVGSMGNPFKVCVQLRRISAAEGTPSCYLRSHI